ncbi:uncharacterized protein LOC108864432 [Galendromus occidentalis]|uniref:Uncharacterized protein LOC108864432 n=1 Tax=Galendromus occidentalis TaxID=34638 RepID=A0AAJ7L4I7_9ACAR|nr:uncharacterized protein LOC108864432 [Galendromus occidentalis]
MTRGLPQCRIFADDESSGLAQNVTESAMRAVTMIIITSLVLFFIEDISCVIKVSHKKPIKIKIQAKPSLLVKPFPFLLLKKYHRKKIRLGWPLSALFTFKALAFLSSLVRKRRRRSTDSVPIIFSAPNTRTWLTNIGSRKNGATRKATKSGLSQESEERFETTDKPPTTVLPEHEGSSEENDDARESEYKDERIHYDAPMKLDRGRNNQGRTPTKPRLGKAERKERGRSNGGKKAVKTEKSTHIAPSTSSDDHKDEEIAEVFRSLRANDHNSCIQRAICEYEAVKYKRKLTPMQESFVDLFGENVSQPTEADELKDSYPFHRAAFIGNSLRDPSICAHTFKTCPRTPDSILPASERTSQPGDTIEVPGPVTNNGPPQHQLGSQAPSYAQNPFGLPGGVPVPVPPNVNVRPGSRASLFPDGTLLIFEAPEDPAPGLPVIPHPTPLDPPKAKGAKPVVDLSQFLPGKAAMAPAVFETELTLTADGKAFNEALPKIPKIIDSGIKLTPQMIELVSGLLKKDNHRGKRKDVVHELLKDIVIGHIQKQITTAWRPSSPILPPDNMLDFALPQQQAIENYAFY